MDFKQLQSFVTVVQEESFTQAAGKLFVSQSTVSTHIHQLESELNTKLILRTTKSLQTTPKGRELYEYALNILELKERMVQACSIESQRIIHLGASTIPSAYILPQLLADFGKLHPDIYFIIHQSDSQGIVDGLMCGAFDMGLIGVEVHEEMLELTPFYADQMVLITPVNEHFLRFRDAGGMTLADICREPMLLREKGSGSKKCVSTYFERMGVDENDLTVTARLNDQESIKNLVAGGLGISIISEKAAEDAVKAGRLMTFPLPDAGAHRQLYVACRRGAPVSGQTQQFIHFVKNFYR